MATPPPLSPHAVAELRRSAASSSPFGTTASVPISELRRRVETSTQQQRQHRRAPPVLDAAAEDDLVNRLYRLPDSALGLDTAMDQRIVEEDPLPLTRDAQERLDARREAKEMYRAKREQKAKETALEKARIRLAYLESMSARRRAERAAMTPEMVKREKNLRARAATSTAPRAQVPTAVSTARRRSGRSKKSWTSEKWTHEEDVERHWTRVAVRLKRSKSKPSLGWLRYVGELHSVTKTSVKGGSQMWLGVELDDPLGKHSGSHKDHVYFKCHSDHGLFCRPHQVRRVEIKQGEPHKPNRTLHGRTHNGRVASNFHAKSSTKAAVVEAEVEDVEVAEAGGDAGEACAMAEKGGIAEGNEPFFLDTIDDKAKGEEEPGEVEEEEAKGGEEVTVIMSAPADVVADAITDAAVEEQGERDSAVVTATDADAASGAPIDADGEGSPATMAIATATAIVIDEDDDDDETNAMAESNASLEANTSAVAAAGGAAVTPSEDSVHMRIRQAKALATARSSARGDKKNTEYTNVEHDVEGDAAAAVIVAASTPAAAVLSVSSSVSMRMDQAKGLAKTLRAGTSAKKLASSRREHHDLESIRDKTGLALISMGDAIAAFQKAHGGRGALLLEEFEKYVL